MSPLPLPEEPALPLFTYGALKPGELAHAQIEPFLDRSTAATVQGLLRLRDGLPLLELHGGGEAVHGHLVWFRGDALLEAWRAVVEFEPRDQLDDGFSAARYRSEVIDWDDSIVGLSLVGNESDDTSFVQVWDYSHDGWGRSAQTLDVGWLVFGEGTAPTKDWTGDGVPDVLFGVAGNDPMGIVVTVDVASDWHLATFDLPYGPDVAVEGLHAEGRDLISYENECEPSCADGAQHEIQWAWNEDGFAERSRRQIRAAAPPPPPPPPVPVSDRDLLAAAVKEAAASMGETAAAWDCVEFDDYFECDFSTTTSFGGRILVWLEGSDYYWEWAGG